MQIIVLDGHTLNPGDNSWDAVRRLGELTVYDRTDVDQILDRARPAGMVLTNKVPLDAGVIASLPSLKFISVLATGYDVVDVAAARRHSIPVSNVPVYGTDAVAQHVFASILHVIHDIGRHNQAIRAGKWQESGDFSFWITPLRELAGRTMGIVGFGKIGRRVGEIANAFGMQVVANELNHGESPRWPNFRWVGIDELFADADVVSLHCPQTESSRGFVNSGLLSLMRPQSILINTARGGLVNEADLAAALNRGQLSAAVLDVVSQEPISPDNPLLAAKNCHLTPHMAWAALEARQRMMKTTAHNIEMFLAGKPVNVVN